MQRRAFITGATALSLGAADVARADDLIGGIVAPGFEPVREAFRVAQATDPGGAQLCVYRRGRVVVDLWTLRDRAHARPFGPDAITVLNSCTKGVMASLIHMLADAGRIDFDAPVARYWPEFAANGKGAITVATLLSHRAGLSSFPADVPLTPKDLADWDRCTRLLAGMAPLWEPGTAVRYHAITFGYLAGELVRRITGEHPAAAVAGRLRGPLDLRLWVGDLPVREEARFAPQFPVPSADPGAPPSASALSLVGGLMAFLNTREGHLAEIPAASGIGNARALARMYAALITGVDGRSSWLARATIDQARALQTAGLPAPPGGPTPRHPPAFGLGYELPRSNVAMLGPGSFGHTGAGGRLAFAHPETGVAAAYVCNNGLWDSANATDARWSWTSALAAVVAKPG